MARIHGWALGVALLAVCGSASAQDRLAEGKAKLAAGDYVGAQAALADAAKSAKGAAAVDASGALFDAQLRTGDWDGAAATAKALAGRKEGTDAGAVLTAELDLLGGRYEEAIRKLEPIVGRNGLDFRARWALGRAHAALGHGDRAFAALDPMADAYVDDKVSSAGDLTLLGLGLWHTGHFKNANQVFGEALRADPRYQEANLRWGLLFLEKYNYRDADQSFEEVLKQDPHEPMALVGRARVDIGSDNDLIQASRRIDEALATNPKLIEGLLVKADIDVRNEDYDAALVTLNRALALNPRSLEALSGVATVRFLRDEPAEMDKAVKAVFAVNPKYADVWCDAAEAGERVHRYVEIVALYEKALAIDADNGRALIGLGIGWSRLGDDEKARRFLDRGFEADPYNVRAFNIASVFYDSMIKQFDLVDERGLRLRLDKKERAVLEPLVGPEMEKARAHYDARYRFSPKPPLQIEIFPDPSLFAIRTVGLPRMGAHGVCFGHVITARSPSAGNFNWEQVLWHEMAHVYHIQLSDSRVPRWFTEGLAVHETRKLRPAWARPMDLELWHLLQRGELVGIDGFNAAFTQAKSLDDILVAYYQASVVVQYVEERWGFEKLRAMLVGWAEKKDTAAVFREALGVDPAAFDAAFREWLRERLVRYAGLFEPDPQAYRELARYESAAAASPDDARAQAELAMSHLANGEPDEAKASIGKAVAADAEEPLTAWLAAQQALHGGDWAGARERLEGLISGGRDGVTIREALATACKEGGDLDGAEESWAALAKMEPESEGAWRALYALRSDRKDDAGALEAAVRAADISQMDAALELEIAALAKKLGKPDVGRAAVLRSLEIAPFAPEVRVAVAEVRLADGDAAAARAELEQALALGPEQPAPVLGLLARAQLMAGDREKARASAGKALAADPDEPQARKVMDELE